MSSHHFVKENQEPALLIWNAQQVQFEKIAPLLEWVPLVIVHQASVDTVLSWGIKIDKVVATASFVQDYAYLLEDQYPLEFLQFERVDDLFQVLSHLVEIKQRAVNILGVQPDNYEMNNGFNPSLDVVLFNWDLRYLLVDKKPLKKWFTASQIVVIPSENNFVLVENFQDKSEQKVGQNSLQELQEGFYQFSSASPFWLGEMF